MSKRTILNRMLSVATLAMMFGSASVYAQSSKDASSQSMENRSSQMTPSAPQSDSSGTSATSSGASGAGGQSASGSDAQSGTSSAAADKAAATSGSASGKALSRSDQNLLRQIAQANIAEIEAAKLAQSKTQNEQVRNYAQQMIDDHTKALQQVQQLAEAKGVTLPTTPDRKHQAMAKKLSNLSGDEFDRRYMAQGGLADHRETHRLLTRAQSRANDPDLKELAAKTLPTVDQHLNMAQQLQAGLASSNASGASGANSGARASGGASGMSNNSSPTGNQSDSAGTSSSSK